MPIYSFENGIHYDDSQYVYDAQYSTSGFVSLDSIQDIDRRARPGNPEFDALLAEIEDVYTTSYEYLDKRGNSRTGQIEYSLFNSDAPSETLKLIILGWGSNYCLPGTARGIAALALADSKQRFAVCNFMGRGESTPLPISRSLAVARTGSFIPAGELLYEALDQSGIMEDAGGMDILGESEGHRLALGAVASGLAVQRSTFVDGPGMNDFGFIGLAHRLQVKEAAHNRQYVEHSTDKWSQELSEDPRKPHGVLDLVRRGTALSQYLLHPKGLGGAGLESDTYQALPYIKDELAIISFELSEITDYEKTERMLGDIAAMATGLRPPLLRHRVGRGLTHSVAVAGPGARSQLLTVDLLSSRQAS